MADVAAYQDALRKYEAAQRSAGLRLKLIRNVATAARQDLAAFIAKTYGLGAAAGAPASAVEGALDMTAWPSEDELSTELEKLYKAWETVRQKWEAMPERDRVGLSRPPQRLSI